MVATTRKLGTWENRAQGMKRSHEMERSQRTNEMHMVSWTVHRHDALESMGGSLWEDTTILEVTKHGTERCLESTPTHLFLELIKHTRADSRTDSTIRWS